MTEVQNSILSLSFSQQIPSQLAIRFLIIWKKSMIKKTMVKGRMEDAKGGSFGSNNGNRQKKSRNDLQFRQIICTLEIERW